MHKFLALIILAVFSCTIASCSTTCKACKGAKEGAQEDWNASCKGLKGADNWIKRNLW